MSAAQAFEVDRCGGPLGPFDGVVEVDVLDRGPVAARCPTPLIPRLHIPGHRGWWPVTVAGHRVGGGFAGDGVELEAADGDFVGEPGEVGQAVGVDRTGTGVDAGRAPLTHVGHEGLGSRYMPRALQQCICIPLSSTC